jgi:hypothetical protein
MSVSVLRVVVWTLGTILSGCFSLRVSPLNTRYMKILMYRVFIYSDCLCIYITPGFKIKNIWPSYVRPGSSCHTYGQNVNTENQCLYYINFLTQNVVFTWRLGQLSRHAAAENSNPTDYRPGAMQSSRRNLHHTSSSHLCLLRSVIARVSRLMVATQQV